MKLKQRRTSTATLAGITGAALIAAAAATAGGAAMAAASASPAISGAERFQILSTSAVSTRSSIIATGRFTAGGSAAGGAGRNGTASVKFPGGTLKITHHTDHTTGLVNPRTCLFTVHGSGTYQVGDGTGKYSRVRGSGKFALTILAVDARNSRGRCTMTRPPAAYQQIITLRGTVRT